MPSWAVPVAERLFLIIPNTADNSLIVQNVFRIPATDQPNTPYTLFFIITRDDKGMSG
ncbi:MAG: hypothetical protein NVSMB52_09420 [Chloroflexota bacterium]